MSIEAAFLICAMAAPACNSGGVDNDAWTDADVPYDHGDATDTGGDDGTMCSLRIFILEDQSGSMADGTPSKWDQARAAIDEVMTSAVAADIEFGFGAFPTDGDCGTGSAVVIHPIPDATAGIVDSYFVDNMPAGATPLSDAMEFFVTDGSAGLTNPEYHNAILLVSDGMDTCYMDCASTCGLNLTCIAECEAESETLVAARLSTTTAQLRDTNEIRTFVIGFGADASDVQLSAISENGGTVLGEWIPASDVDELTAALETVIGEMLECNPIII